MENLAGQGLVWIPTAGNLITGACYLGCLAVSSKLDQSPGCGHRGAGPHPAAAQSGEPVGDMQHNLLLPNQVKTGKVLAGHAAAGPGAQGSSAELLLTQGGGHIRLGRQHAGTGMNLGLALLTLH